MTTLVQQLRALCLNATPGPWELQTSNSWRRIGTAGGRFADGDVLAPTTQRGDNHPDLAARQEDLDYIVAADPTTVLALLDELDQLKAENATLLDALQETNHCLVACLTGGEVSASRAGKAIEAAAIAIEQAVTKEQKP